CARKPSPFLATKLRAQFYKPWMATIKRWAQTADQEVLELPDSAVNRLCPEGMEAVLSGKADPGHWPDHFEAVVQLRRDLATLPDGTSAARWHAARWVAA